VTGPVLRLSRTAFPVTTLGPGTRLVVWTQGCPLACRGCMSLDTWDPAGGVEVAVDTVTQTWRAAIGQGATGLTISGGEPLAQPAALGELLAAADRIRREVPAAGGSAAGREPDLLVYTGYEEAELDGPAAAALEHADAVITGRFDVSRPTDLIWRGSANQRLLPRTPLGRRRYGRYVDHAPPRSPLHVEVAGDGVRIIGVPRRSELARIERRVREQVAVTGATWRPWTQPPSQTTP